MKVAEGYAQRMLLSYQEAVRGSIEPSGDGKLLGNPAR